MAERYLFLIGKADHPDTIPKGGASVDQDALSAKVNLAIDHGYSLVDCGARSTEGKALWAAMIKVTDD